MFSGAVVAPVGGRVKEREIFKTFSREIVGKLPNTPVLPEKWIEAHHAEIWNQYKNTNVEVKAEIKQKAEIDRKAIAQPTDEQIAKLQELQKTGEIKKFYPNSQKSDAVILVDTGSGVVFWWEFFDRG